MIDTNNVYNYYSATLAKHSNSKLELHKSTDLKSLYSRIMKLNKNSPLYMVNLDSNTQNYAIGIKENAIELQQLATLLGDSDDSAFNQREVASSDESKVYASLLNNDYNKIPNPLSIEVAQLASHQINLGNYVRSDYQTLANKEHTFEIVTPKNTYSFSVPVGKSDHNKDVQDNLVKTINNSNIAISASLDIRDNTSAIVLESNSVGAVANANINGLAFWISDTTSGNSLASVFGLNRVLEEPTDAIFTINGETHTSKINNISINNTVSMDLLAPTSEPIDIHAIADTKQVIHTVEAFVDSYNRFVDNAASNEANNKSRNKLLNDISYIYHQSENDFISAGLSIDDSNHMVMDSARLSNSIKNGDLRELFGDNSSLRKNITRTTDKVTIDPIAYVDKLMVSYPNLAQASYPNPYVPSKYAGLLYNQYL